MNNLAFGQFDAYRRETLDTDTIAENNRSIELQLAFLRLYAIDSKCPTNAGILLFGKNSRFFLPGSYVQYLRFPGTDLIDIPSDQAEISGDLVSILREMEGSW